MHYLAIGIAKDCMVWYSVLQLDSQKENPSTSRNFGETVKIWKNEDVCRLGDGVSPAIKFFSNIFFVKKAATPTATLE